ncbi:restriction endonuclease subunit S [Aphanothece hegewaldii CCALA 016]|uniref:Restriction endonuclease subunit S n=1 Tax=Aphanothece hegewaldii CCALA 016 TaxID=2107694 RepID=A0A2T1LRB5_9CHRO|nr:restriction endonuclease subunit S [Aphanothece hegewaldii]PSF31075.1 restriction endonuclease subunit S [Aphanothece hegewaldii CCALA 016]
MSNNFLKDWQLLPLEKCMSAIIDYRGKTPTKTTFGIPLITAKIVKNGRIHEVEEYIAQEDYELWMRRGMPQSGDVVMTTEAPLGEIAQLNGKKVALAQRIITLRGKPTLLDNTYLKFLMQSDFIQNQLYSRASGTTVLGIKQSELRQINLIIPPLSEQKAIAHILGTLDDKIELNQQMNQTLEAMARAIFKSWFVDFDPVRAKMEGRQPVGMDAATAELFPDSFEESALGLIPKGWKIEKLGNLAKNFSKSFDFLKKDQVIFINTGDVLSGKFLHNNLISKEGLPGQAKKSIDKNDILFNEIRPANQRYAFVDFDARDYVVSTKFMIIRALEDIEPRLLYRILILKNTLTEFQIVAESRSGTFPQITFESISYFPIILTPKVVQKAFLTMIKSFEKQIWQNENQNYALTTIRDTLLPKLMSGEIRVKEAEKLLEAVA